MAKILLFVKVVNKAIFGNKIFLLSFTIYKLSLWNFKLNFWVVKMELNFSTMEISEIKQRLMMSQVLAKYGLKPDKHMRMNCPFHEDKTPSFQVYYKTHTDYCFSSNCPTHGKSLDVIDFIMYREQCNKHEAILKAAEMLNPAISGMVSAKSFKAGLNGHTVPAATVQSISKAGILTKMFTYFTNAVHKSPPTKQFIENRKLDYEKLEIGYNPSWP
jgi:hypothetical protein